MTKEKNNELKNIILKKYAKKVVLLSFFSILISIFVLAFAYSTKFLINSATNKDKDAVLVSALLLIGCIIGTIIFRVLHSYQLEKTRSLITIELRNHLFKKILKSDLQTIEKIHSADFMNKLTSDVSTVAGTYTGLIPLLVGMSVELVGAICLLVTLDFIFTIIFILGSLVIVGVLYLFRKKIKAYHTATLDALSVSKGFMLESLNQNVTLKAYQLEDKAVDKSKELLDLFHLKRMKQNVLNSLSGAIFSLLSNIGLIFALTYFSIKVLKGGTDFGEILSIILILKELERPITSFSGIGLAYYEMEASLERLLVINNYPQEEYGISSDDFDQIKISDLSFSYPNKTVLEHFNLTINKNDKIAIVGESGTGKTTLFKLLLSIYKPNDGTINIIYQNETHSISPKNRNLFSYVGQENFLFSGTIWDNLIFFTNEKENLEEKVNQAIEIACAEFVYELKDGLNTKLAEFGKGLSIGQIERLMIARAILADHPIMLFDESTASLDIETEERLLNNIKDLNKTVIFVTHRKSVLRIADKIINIEK